MKEAVGLLYLKFAPQYFLYKHVRQLTRVHRQWRNQYSALTLSTKSKTSTKMIQHSSKYIANITLIRAIINRIVIRNRNSTSLVAVPVLFLQQLQLLRLKNELIYILIDYNHCLLAYYINFYV